MEKHEELRHGKAWGAKTWSRKVKIKREDEIKYSLDIMIIIKFNSSHINFSLKY